MQASDFCYHSNDPICRELTLAHTLILIMAHSNIPKWWARDTAGLVCKQVNGQKQTKNNNSTLHPGNILQPNKDWEEMRRKHTTAGWAWLGSLDSFPHEHFTVWSLMVVPWMEQIAFVAASFEPNLQTFIMITACMIDKVKTKPMNIKQMPFLSLWPCISVWLCHCSFENVLHCLRCVVCLGEKCAENSHYGQDFVLYKYFNYYF